MPDVPLKALETLEVTLPQSLQQALARRAKGGSEVTVGWRTPLFFLTDSREVRYRCPFLKVRGEHQIVPFTETSEHVAASCSIYLRCGDVHLPPQFSYLCQPCQLALPEVAVHHVQQSIKAAGPGFGQALAMLWQQGVVMEPLFRRMPGSLQHVVRRDNG